MRKKLWRTSRTKWFGIHLYRKPSRLESDILYRVFDDDESKPKGLTWERWESNIKKICPWQFWFRNTFQSFVENYIFIFKFDYPNENSKRKHLMLNFNKFSLMEIINSWYIRNILDRINPYNVVKIKSMSRNYSDSCDLLLHAPMQILIDFVERGMKSKYSYLSNINDFDDDKIPEENKKIYKETLEIYNWWKNYKNREEEFQIKHDNVSKIRKEKKISRSEWANKIYEIDQEFEKEKEEMLIRLMKIRNSLWD